MIVTMITRKQILTQSLPNKVSGRYELTVNEPSDGTVTTAAIEGLEEQWFIHSSSSLILLGEDGQERESIRLGHKQQVISGKCRTAESNVQFYVEPSTMDRLIYKKYCVRADCRLNIGRAQDNQIIFDNKYVSSHHAILIWQNGCWSVTDTQSSNGTFVNSERIATRSLAPGDAVYIMGLKIIVGNGFFAMNDPDGAIRVSSNMIAELAQQAATGNSSEYEEKSVLESYQSSPRLRRCVEKGSISIDPPPPLQKPDETPLALLLGPALTMGLTAVVMAVVAAINLMNGTSTMLTALPTMIMSFSMLCGTLLWPLLTKRSENRKAERTEKKRQERYREYLDKVRNEIYELSEYQKGILLENCPSIDECEDRAINRERTLWERTIGQNDFLSLRLGVGDVPLNAEIKYPESRFSVDVDLLQNEVSRMEKEQRVLSDAPVTCSLINHPLIGIAGAEEATEAFLRTLVLQIAALHGYQEVKLAFFIDDKNQSSWESYRLLPHVKEDETGLRYFAVGSEETKTLSLHLEHIWSEQNERFGNGVETPSVYYVLVATDTAVAEKASVLAKAGAQKKNIGFCGITAARRVSDLPRECSAVIDLDGETASLYEQNTAARAISAFRPEFSDLTKSDRVCSILGNLTMHTQAEKYSLPPMLTFLEMYGIGKTEHLNSPARWKENSPINSLQAPIGVGDDGSLLYLDLHEKVHGPHGLVAGMTGSGKSEFVITYILSMAVNYHPDEVAFILIDYKGGGLAGAFEDRQTGVRLPHLAGTITNLDGSEVNRALISIQSELRRRQEIFNHAKQLSGDGTMDIYKYQKLFRSGIVADAVPHLFIVSDEFAELKAQQPDFMAQLISAARIGRSLGVHLILATQKPTGVVDDQIWSNSRFRVCLKVQERTDSAEMLKRPDAAELRNTGRFYLQVGFNELFELGQSAWCGAPYVPSDRVRKQQDDRVAVIDHLGRILADVKPNTAAKAADTSQIVSIVQYLFALARSENITERQLWLPPIPALIYLDDIAEKYHRTVEQFELAPVIGEFDDPFHQAQGLLTIPFSREGNAIIYGATGGGKAILLNTMLVDLLRHYDSRHLNVYIIDLGEETLRIFDGAPQVGEVLLSSDIEKISGLFKMLQEEIADRKKRFTEGDGGYSSNCRRADAEIPQILVIIRNYAAFAEQFESLDERLIQLTRECSKYGIYFLMTANAANTVRYRVAQNFSLVYALQLNDTSDYVGIFGGTGGVYPSKIIGRGIYKADRVYEFQTAHFAPDSSQEALRSFISGLAADADGTYARPIPTLPARVVPSFFGERISISSLPIGIEKATLHTCSLDLSKTVITMVLSQNIDELGDVVQGISEQLSKLDGSLTFLDALGIANESPEFAYRYLSSNYASCIKELFNEMVRRNNTYKKAVSNNQELPPYMAEYFVITGFQALCESLTEQDRDELNTLLEKAESYYNVRFIICDTAKSTSGYSTQPWYKRHITGTDGVWVGDGIADQYILKIGKLSNEMYSEVPPYFGYHVKRGKAILTKLIVGECSRKEASK